MEKDNDSDEDNKENDNCVDVYIPDDSCGDGDNDDDDDDVHGGADTFDEVDDGDVTTANVDANDEDDLDLEQKIESEEETDGVPLDHGWAWVVNFGSFVVFLVFYSQSMVLSVLITDIIDHFQTSLTTITIMIACNCLAYSLGCQLSVNFIVPRASVRKLFVTSATLNAACTFLLMLAPNMAVFFIVHVFKLLVQGLAMMPILTLVGHYFKRRRALASSLTLLGTSSASLFSPLFVRYLIGEYGWQGCFLLWGGFEMQAIVATSLMRPLSSYKARRFKDEKETDQAANGQKKTTNRRKEFDHVTIYKNKKSEAFPEKLSWNRTGCNQNGHPSDYELEVEERSHLSSPSNTGRHQAGSWSERLDDSLVNVRSKDLNCKSKLLDEKQLSVSSNAVDSIRKSTQTSIQITDVSNGICRARSRTKATSAQNFISLEFLNRIDLCPSLMSSSMSIAKSEIEPVSVDGSETLSSPEKSESAGTRCLLVIKAIFNFSALKSLPGLFYIVSYVLARNVGLVATYLPAHGEEVGLDKTKAALLLAIYGGVDMVSRVIFGFIGDLHLVRPKYIIAVCAFFAGLVACFANLYTTFPLLVFCSAALGFFGYVSLSLNTNNIIDIHGLDKLGTYLSQASFILALGSMLQYPIIGIIVESTGTLVSVFLYVAASYLTSATLTLLYDVITRFASPGRKRAGKDAQVTVPLDPS